MRLYVFEEEHENLRNFAETLERNITIIDFSFLSLPWIGRHETHDNNTQPTETKSETEE